MGKQLTEYQRVLMEFPCLFCSALRGMRCTSPSGRTCPPHDDRYRQAVAAHRLPLVQGTCR